MELLALENYFKKSKTKQTNKHPIAKKNDNPNLSFYCTFFHFKTFGGKILKKEKQQKQTNKNKKQNETIGPTKNKQTKQKTKQKTKKQKTKNLMVSIRPTKYFFFFLKICVTRT